MCVNKKCMDWRRSHWTVDVERVASGVKRLLCHHVYFVSVKGHTCYGYETVNGVLKMKVNT
jgi:hypothetical protein